MDKLQIESKENERLRSVLDKRKVAKDKMNPWSERESGEISTVYSLFEFYFVFLRFFLLMRLALTRKLI